MSEIESRRAAILRDWKQLKRSSRHCISAFVVFCRLGAVFRQSTYCESNRNASYHVSSKVMMCLGFHKEDISLAVWLSMVSHRRESCFPVFIHFISCFYSFWPKGHGSTMVPLNTPLAMNLVTRLFRMHSCSKTSPASAPNSRERVSCQPGHEKVKN